MLGSPYHRIFWKNQNLMYTVEPSLTELWPTETQVKRKSFEINNKAKLTLKHACNTETMHYRWPLLRAPEPRCLPPVEALTFLVGGHPHFRSFTHNILTISVVLFNEREM